MNSYDPRYMLLQEAKIKSIVSKEKQSLPSLPSWEFPGKPFTNG